MPDLILASTSPRRKELLDWLELDFDVVPSDFDEDSVECDEVVELVEELALQKATAVAKNHLDKIVIGADTMVSVDGEIIGKATNDSHARAILKRLSGTKHEITTGVAILEPYHDQPIIFHDTSYIVFRHITDDEIETYLKTDIWQDKAGAYAVQDDPLKFVQQYDGSFTNIIGLPLPRVAEELKSLGVDIYVDVVSTIEANTGRREI